MGCSMLRKRRITFTALAILAILIFGAVPLPALLFSEAEGVPPNHPFCGVLDVFTVMEARIAGLINREREKIGLSPLTVVPELSEFARVQSRNMVERGLLSHEAVPGRPFSRRIKESGFLYRICGENIARSESPDPESIHQALMGSPRHREQILTPEYDRVGVAVETADGKVFFVTEVFLRSLAPLTREAAENAVKDVVNAGRERVGLPSIRFLDTAVSLARKLSDDKAERRPFSGIPSGPGEMVVVSVRTADIKAWPFTATPSVLSALVEYASAGVRFGRDEDFPGGVYWITILLFPKRTAAKNPEEIRSGILEAVNKSRKARSRIPLTLDKGLSDQAESRARELSVGRSLTMPDKFFVAWASAGYQASDPENIPGDVLSAVEGEDFRRIGIGFFFGETADFPNGVFWVMLIVK